MGRGKLTYKSLVLLLAYLLSLNAFLSLKELVEDSYFYLFFLLLHLGLFLELKGERIKERYLFPFALFGLLLSLSRLSLDDLISPLAEALLLLLAVKWLAEKKVRDYLQILLVSFLGVALATAASTDPLSLGVFLLQLFLSVLFLVLLNFYRNLKERPVPPALVKKLLLFSFSFTLGAFILSWLFFVVLPRMEKPLFDPFGKGRGGITTGLADGVDIGEVGEIQTDERVAFRVFGVEFKEPPYWRALTLEYFDGRRWRPVPKPPEREPSLEGKRYLLIMEPLFSQYLPLLDYPVKLFRAEGLKFKPVRLAGGTYYLKESFSKPLKVEASSLPLRPQDPPLPVHLQLPEDLSPRVKELAERLGKGAKSPEEVIKRVERFFKEEGFSYTTKLENYEGDPLEAFLFKHKRGNCEYFASATAVLLRLNGVPARLVAGFHGAVKNQFGDYYLVLHAMAHVWVEAHDGKAWLRLDTTPPYAPPALRKVNRLALLYDALLAFWYKNVVDFSVQKQKRLLLRGSEIFRSLKEKLKELLPFLLGVLLTLSVGGGLILFYLREVRKTPENLLRKLRRKLKRFPVADKSPEEIVRFFEGKREYPYVKFIVRTYQRWKYSPYKDKEELREAYKALKKL